MHGSTQAFCQPGKADWWLIPSAVTDALDVIQNVTAVEYRLRIQQAFEGLSVAGSVGAYQYHGRSADGRVADISVTSPSPACVTISVLSRENNGVASEDLLAVVRNALNGEDVRPVADRVTVQSAAIVEYQINATLYLYPGPESEPIRAAAVKKLEAYITAQHRLGRDIRLSAIYAALHVEGVQRVELAAPLTGTPTTPTARQGTNNTQIANTAFVMAAIAALVDSSPDALNTLNELAAALGNDPNFATTMTNALAGKQPKDATLTALAGLATAADRFPYFTGNDVASLATLTKVGRDILAKSTVAAVIEYLGLQETVNRAGNAVQKNGDTLSGGLTFENDSILAWIRNTDWAKIGFKNDADGDTDSYMWFETGDNGNEYFKWRSRQSTTTKDLMTLKWDALNILVNAVINGCFGVGTTNALGGSSIVLGDNDTGFKQNGDGILDVYANSQRVFRFQNGVAIAFKNIQAGDSKKFSLSSSNTSTKNITFNLWGASTRPVVAELGDEAGWHFYSQRNTDNSVIFAVNGQMQPSNWGNFDSRYVKDVRLGTRVVQLMARGGRYEKAGHTITGLRIIGEVDGDDEAIFRPIQKYINGTWYNVAQV